MFPSEAHLLAGAPKKDQMVVEWSASPQRSDFHRAEGRENAVEVISRGVVGRRCLHPKCNLGQKIARDGNLESQGIILEAGPDDQHAAGCDPGCSELEQ